jgi:hypothetical protein
MLDIIKQDDSENLVLTGLIREATNHGITGNAAARNASFKMLSDLIEKAKAGREGTDRVKGNVIRKVSICSHREVYLWVDVSLPVEYTIYK